MTTTPSAAPSVQWLEISADQAGQRIDNFLLTRLKGAPRSLIYRILRSGEVRVNKGRIKPEYRLKAGDQLRLPPLRLPALGAPEALSKGLLERLEAAIVFEDSGLIALNKPCGIAVHGGSGLHYGVIEALRQLRPDCKALELVHRLDRDTSGLLLIAKKRSLLRHLHQALRGELAAGQVDKRYLALLQGDFPASLKQIDAPLLKNTLHSGERMVQVQHQGKPALTRFSIVQRFAKLATLVEARPITGRTHQIRVHARHAGHPIAGDDKYGNADFSAQIRALGGKRLFLHAWRLRLPLPEGGMLELEAAPDAPWQHCLQRLSEQASSN